MRHDKIMLAPVSIFLIYMVCPECVRNLLLLHCPQRCRHVDHVQGGIWVSVALHDNLSRRFVIDCDPFFVEDSDTVIVTKGAD